MPDRCGCQPAQIGVGNAVVTMKPGE